LVIELFAGFPILCLDQRRCDRESYFFIAGKPLFAGNTSSCLLMLPRTLICLEMKSVVAYRKLQAPACRSYLFSSLILSLSGFSDAEKIATGRYKEQVSLFKF
jgi:hypothetical protein